MIITSVVSFYYYFGIIRQMFMRSDIEASEVKSSDPLSITAWLCALAGVAMGFFPQVLLNYIEQVFSLVKDFIIK
jgi:NADH-quinone oxidoreductase subunit N